MKEQLLVVDSVGEDTVLHSTMDAEDMLNGKRRRDRATAKGIYYSLKKEGTWVDQIASGPTFIVAIIIIDVN